MGLRGKHTEQSDQNLKNKFSVLAGLTCLLGIFFSCFNSLIAYSLIPASTNGQIGSLKSFEFQKIVEGKR